MLLRSDTRLSNQIKRRHFHTTAALRIWITEAAILHHAKLHMRHDKRRLQLGSPSALALHSGNFLTDSPKMPVCEAENDFAFQL